MNKLVKLLDKPQYRDICILGFGREGKSTLSFLNNLSPRNITIADRVDIDLNDAGKDSCHHVDKQAGEDYLDNLGRFDLIIKSPGVKLPQETEQAIRHKLVSQTMLFMEAFHKQIIGITGTKGKSTTSSLIHHILKESGKDTILVGNIGIPAFNLTDRINAQTVIVFELSAQQLAEINHSPHLALFLSLFPDHLDYFGDMEHYGMAKYNIVRYQNGEDTFIYNPTYDFVGKIAETGSIPSHKVAVTAEGSEHFDTTDGRFVRAKRQHEPAFDFEKVPLKGIHNFTNTLFAIEAATLVGVAFEDIIPAIYSFKPLDNRLEYVGCFGGKHFYNDSIATVPDAAIAALNAIDNVQTIILGGYDRGIDLTNLIKAITENPVTNIIFTGVSGKRMLDILNTTFPNHTKTTFYFEHYDNLVETAVRVTPEGCACLLSPASPSFDSFKDFEERGKFYKNKIKFLFTE